MKECLKQGLLGFLGIIIFLLGCNTENAPDGGNSDGYHEWPTYLGDIERSHYSVLDQINIDNVNSLRVAWIYRTGDATENRSEIQCNPIMVEGNLYLTSPKLKLIALNPVTGKQKWVFDPFADANSKVQIGVNRGVAYWSDGKKDKRIIYTAGPYIYCVNAVTGKIISTFGDGGKVDLHKGLDRDVDDLFVGATSPGTIFEDLFITSIRTAEEPYAAPGHIRAYDVRTGEQKWIFHTIPHPGEFGYETWEDKDAWKYIGGTNNWSGISVDIDRGMIFASLGSPAYDFYGGFRKGKGLFGNSILALDARTGKYIWHYQTVHHDIWDRDLPAPTNLVTVVKDGKQIDAVAQITKWGVTFVLDRETGNPIFPIVETPVPTNSTLKGEKLWPTQPIPVLPKPFTSQSFTEKDLNTLVPDTSYKVIKDRLSKMETGKQFIPLTIEGEGTVIFFPGFDGGGEWGGASYDPELHYLFVNAGQVPWTASMAEVNKPKPNGAETVKEFGARIYSNNCSACHGSDRSGSTNFPSLINIEKHFSSSQVEDIISNGRNRMPPFGQLSKDEKQSLVAFLLNLKEGNNLHEGISNKIKNYESNPERSPFVPYRMTDHRQFRTPEGYPANMPPWGTLTAIDLNSGEHAWQVPLGEYPELTEKGIPVTGSENYGGAVVTKGGLIFIAATPDGKFRAFNKKNGKQVWEFELPAAGFATPSTYMIEGEQYIVIACGGGKLDAPSGDSYVAFKLPE